MCERAIQVIINPVALKISRRPKKLRGKKRIERLELRNENHEQRSDTEK